MKTLRESILKESILKESILTSIGQGDRYHQNQLLKKWGLDIDKAHWISPTVLDYDGDVHIEVNNMNLKDRITVSEPPFNYFTFNEVKGDFILMGWSGMKSLKGCPRKVGKTFSCQGCTKFHTLEGGPMEVGGDYICMGCNTLQSLKGIPKVVNGNLNLTMCSRLKTLEGGPEKVRGSMVCDWCKNLKNLKGGPIFVGGDATFLFTGLESLQGSPKNVWGNFNCSGCKNLIDLEGAPERIIGNVYFENCGKKFTIQEIKKHSKVSGQIFV